MDNNEKLLNELIEEIKKNNQLIEYNNKLQEAILKEISVLSRFR